jgi:M6 family metalloprotease-like protein
VQHPETLACAHHWTDLCPSVTAARWEWAVEEAMQIVLDDPATDFSDLDEDGSGVVEQHEAMLLVVNALPVLGPTNPFGSAGGITRSFPSECVGPRAGGKVSLCMQFSSVGEGTGVSTIRHELTHLLGAVDLYGVSSNNYLRSLMGPTIPRDHAEDVHEWFALDPWHKMVLGWEWPLVEDVSSGRSRVGLGLLVAEKAYKSSLIYDSERGTNEFFLLEFRDRRTVHDADTVGTGVGLWQAQVRDDLLPVRLPVEGGGDDAAILFYGAPDGALGSGWYWDSTHGEIRPTWYDGTPVPTSLTIEPIEAGDTKAVVNFVHDRESVTTTTTPTTTE